MKISCSPLRQHATNILNFEKKKMLQLTKEELKSQQDARNCNICAKIILKNLAKNRNYRNFRDLCHYTGKYRDAAHRICNWKFNLPNEISVVFHNGSNRNYHFIIKKLAKEIQVKFECLGENKKR